MKNLYKIAALAIFGLFFFINIITLNDGHNWGDDFAQYIQHAINLVEHKPYASGISYDLWVAYPPGFPFLLSSMIYWFGINFKVLKFLNVLFWALGALAAYGLALRRLDLFWARMITVWFLTSPLFFFFKQNVLSDIPFMCFVLLSTLSFMKFEEYQEKGLSDSSRIFLLSSIFCMSYALLIRWAGISLILAVVLYFLVVKRDWKGSLVFILGAAVSFFIAFQCGCWVAGYFTKTTVLLFQQWFWVSWSYLTYTLQVILKLYISDEKYFSTMITPAVFVLINNTVGVFFLVMAGIFLYRLYQRKISFMGCFVSLYLIGAVFWPVHEGFRYLLPVMVPMTIYLIEWVKPAWRKLAVVIFLFLILQNVFVIAANFKFNDDDIYQKEALEMMQWVKLHIKPGENYMFSHPRALGFLTHRTGYSFGAYQQNMGDWYKRINPLHINYLIVDKRLDSISQYNHFRFRVGHDELYVNRVWDNRFYKIYNVTLPINSGPVPAHFNR